MTKNILGFLFFSFVLFNFSSAISSANSSASSNEYTEPPNACYQGCNSFMSQLLFEFETDSDQLYLEPAVFSGECRHNSRSYNPDQKDYAVVMIDRHPTTKEYYFSTQFSFFAGKNDFARWSVDIARQEMSPYWLDHGSIKRSHETKTSRVIIPYDDGSPAIYYFIRQNPRTGELYYITYFGIEQISFCRLTKH